MSKPYVPNPKLPFTTNELINDIWYRFLFNLAQQVNTVGYGLTATGTNLATALPLVADYSEFATVAAGTGAALPSASKQVGIEWIVWNNGANTLTLYSQSGETVNGSASISIAAGAFKRIIALSSTVWLTA